MRTARYLICLSLLTAAVLAPLSTAGAADISQKVVATIPVCFHPIGVAVNPATDHVYVPCVGDWHGSGDQREDKHGDRYPPSRRSVSGRPRSIPAPVWCTSPIRAGGRLR